MAAENNPRDTGSVVAAVTALWRYPVKSLQGERLPEAPLTQDGIAGDRTVHVATPRGPITGRTRHQLLTLAASTGADGTPLVDGIPWHDPRAAALVRQRAGPDARLTTYAGPERFDIGNLLVTTDDELDAFARRHGSPLDPRRLRPEVVPGLVEVEVAVPRLTPALR